MTKAFDGGLIERITLLKSSRLLFPTGPPLPSDFNCFYSNPLPPKSSPEFDVFLKEILLCLVQS